MEENSNGKTIWAIAGAILLILIVGYLLWARSASRVPSPAPGGGTPPPADGTPTPPKTPGTTPDAMTPQSSSAPSEETKKEITVSGSEFSFSPSTITVKAGEKVKLTFMNTGKAPHDLMIKEIGKGTKTISGGQSDTIEFTAPNSGTLSFFCSVGNHAEKGMMGMMKVE